MLRLNVLISFLAALVVAACSAGSGGPVIESGPRYVSQPADAAYRLAAGDKVRMTVFNEELLSGEFSVSTGGNLSLPLIGDVKADGRTTDEVVVDVRTRLADGYLRDPKVSMEVVAYRPFFILGEVKSPGQYPYASGMTALNAVATAQGFSPRAERKVAYIRPNGAEQETAYRLTPDLRIQPGDTVRIGERYF